MIEKGRNDEDSVAFVNQLNMLQREGFSPLVIEFDERFTPEEIEHRIYDRRRQLLKYSPTTKSNTGELDDESELIADPTFGALLNEDYEIIVGGKVYKYTPYGLFVALQADYAEMIHYIESLSHGQAKQLPATNNFEQLTQKISFFKPILDENNFPKNANPNTKSTLNILGLRACSGHETTLFNKVFGASLDCSEHFTSNRRIKTKAWNQNYGLWSSIGISVRSQKKMLGVWVSKKADELVLGYESITFKYPNVNLGWPTTAPKFFYEYNGRVYDELGKHIKDIWDTPRSLFQTWPQNSLTEKTKLYIYYYQTSGDVLHPTYKIKDILKWTETDQTKINKYVERLTTQAIQRLHSFGENVLESEDELTVTIFSSTSESTDVYFTSANWVERQTNENKIQETFDFNTAQIGFSEKVGGSSGSFNPSLVYKTSKNYSDVEMIFFGAGRSGSSWIGNRLFFED